MAPEDTAAQATVRLWTVDVASVDPERALGLLSVDERARAAALASGPARRRFLAARATLRAGLGELTGTDPAALAFATGAHGKPRPAGGGPLRFNVSHSGDLVLVAAALGREVGVDVERQRPRARMDAIAARCFSPAERAALESAGAGRIELFYAIWTAREAFVKATGRGLAAARDSFAIPPWPAGRELPVPIEEPGLAEPRFRLLRLSPAPGYGGALVAGGAGWRVEHGEHPAALAGA